MFCKTLLYIIDCSLSVSRSSTWSRIIKSREEVASQILWILGEGNVKFWKDRWLKDGRLIDFITPPSDLIHLYVRDAFLKKNDWWKLCISHLNHSMITSMIDNGKS